MTKSELIEKLKKYHKGEIYMHHILTAIDDYSYNGNGKSIVTISLPNECLDGYSDDKFCDRFNECEWCRGKLKRRQP